MKTAVTSTQIAVRLVTKRIFKAIGEIGGAK
jgi:hypothetical protein